MSLKVFVGLDFMVEGFTCKAVIKVSCACFLPDKLFLSALSELSRATTAKLCLACDYLLKWLGWGTATGTLWRRVNVARLDHWDLINL